MSTTITSLRDRLGSSIFSEIYGASELPDLSDRSDAAADLAAAAAEVESAVSVRYTLPVSGVRSSALVDDWTLTLAVLRAYMRPAAGDIPVKIKDAAAGVRTALSELRTGAYRLPDASERLGASFAFAKNSSPVFGRENMEGF